MLNLCLICLVASIDVSKFNTQNVNMENMFDGCSILTSIDVSKLNIKKFQKFFNKNLINIKK